jgi:hypothetical protein
MSANNAPGEVNKDKVFDSPNISSAEDEIEEPEVDKEAEERKKRETVDIDGVPIEGKDIKYKAEDIKKKSRMNYFVDVEGSEERAKAAAKKAEDEKNAAKHKAEEEKKTAERKEKEAKEAAERKVSEEKKHLEEINAYVKRQKKEKAHEAKKEKARDSRFRKLFWTGKRKLIIPAAIALLTIIGICVYFCVVIPLQNFEDDQESRALADAEAQRHDERTNGNAYYESREPLDKSEDLKSALDNYDYDTVELIFQEYIDKAENSSDKARLYMDEAKRIWDTNPDDEKDRIYRILLQAYEIDPEDTDVLQSMIDIYNYYQDYDKSKIILEEQEKVYASHTSENGTDFDAGRTDG